MIVGQKSCRVCGRLLDLPSFDTSQICDACAEAEISMDDEIEWLVTGLSPFESDGPNGDDG